MNLTHVNARKIEIIWEEEDLLSLFCRRVRDSSDFVKDAKLGDFTDKGHVRPNFPGKLDSYLRDLKQE